MWIHVDNTFITKFFAWICLPAATKLGQGNIFTSVCLSTGGEGCLPQCMLGYTPWDQTPTPQSRPPWGADTPPDQAHIPGSRHPPQTRHTPPEADTPGPGTPPRADTPPGADPPRTRPSPPPEQTSPREADCIIRLTSSRYASYWNAILVYIKKHTTNFDIIMI